ncbi:hypothetical protein BJ508DRAFT_66261 [Ascobolus immersus RN42]|uniref:CBM1 domain-containing protein n=1 Tax=Ascobolus immersus RN42 TaxID=1160509 RepID=A0A3N4IBJ4_ASCIM|nr:hypothetical protein BJ508DRAFT_66261 [Ascobolus immersus RN42]
MKITISFLAILPFALAQVGGYGQCGGNNYSGSKECQSGWHCEKLNDWYSQCLPGGGSSSSTTSTTSIPSTTPTTSITTPIPTGTGPGTTLLSGWYWIRAVAAPNFHKYLQSAPPRTASRAVIENMATAAQANIIAGQLVQTLDASGSKVLYAHVTPKAGSETKLQVTWSTEKDTYGTFSWSGDTLTWSTPGIQRQNNAAFLVCENQNLYVNLGAYAYLTPAGCVDQTIHYYNGATVD